MIPRGGRAAVRSLALLTCLTALGCLSTAPPSTPPAPSLTPVPGGSAGEEPGQTDTAWGRIWDALPPSFPVPAEAAGGRAGERGISGSFSVGASGETTANLVQAGLDEAGYKVESRTDAADGAVVIEAVGAATTCLVQVRVTPLSGTTRVAVLYGAGCAFE